MLLALALIPFTQWPDEIVKAHWIWGGAKTEKGTPIMRVEKTTKTARRVFYTLFNDDPEAADKGQHLCDCGVLDCVNPVHSLFKPYKIAGEESRAPLQVSGEVRGPMTDDIDELAAELVAQYAIREPTSFADLHRRPEFEDFDKEDIIKALNKAQLPIPA